MHCVPVHREGQLRDDRHADDGRIAVAEGHDDRQGRVRRQAAARRRAR